MIRVTSIEIERFRGFRGRETVDLRKPVTVVVGPNGAGKSSVLNAVEWCLFGSVVEKKSSGIEERESWAVRNREAGEGPVRVALAFDIGGGAYRLERVREEGAKEDELILGLPDGGSLGGAEAEARGRELGLPDWETYRRAHCQHQETARRRLLEKGDRNAALASLLGMEDDSKIVESLKGTKLAGDLGQAIAEIEADLENELERPLREVREAEDRAVRRGVPKERVGSALIDEVTDKMVERAARLADSLGVDSGVPDPRELEAVLAWAVDWPSVARKDAAPDREIRELRKQLEALMGEVATAEPREKRVRDRKKALHEAAQAGGDAAARKDRLARAEANAEAATEALRDANELGSLLEQAAAVLGSAADPDVCPVCGSQESGLATKITERLEGQAGVVQKKLIAERDRARREVEAAKRAVNDLIRMEADLADAGARLNETRQRLEALLGDEAHGDIDLLAAARRRIVSLDHRKKETEAVLDEREKALASHGDDLDLLRDLKSWAEARRRAEERIDLTKTEEWHVLQRALDAAAGLAADLDALAAAARDAHGRRIEERKDEVNSYLERYADTITGGRFLGGVLVAVKRTAKSIRLSITDGTGENLLAVLNQGELNALSIALLFAQAEAAAASGGFGLVVLDDPCQSMDDLHEHGIADAIGEIGKSCGVLCGATPSPIVQRLRDYVPVPWAFVHLERREGQEVAVKEVETR
ncbi:MAG: AAA family ATPase [Polyangia bacterium]